MTRIVLALAALLLFPPLAQAASFDCAKAGTSFEKAICASPELSLRDEVLAQAYATALGGLSKPVADGLKATQHAWLDYAARTCSDDAQPIPGNYTDDQTQCLSGEFSSRITSLEGSRMQGGYRFYPWELYLVERDPDATAETYNKVATKHFSTVKIDSDSDVAKAFNDMTENMRVDDDVKIGDGTNLFEKGTDNLAAGDISTDVENTTRLKDITSNRIALTSEYYWYGHGAAHGNYGITYTHFLINAKRKLVGTDVFSAGNWAKVFGKLVVERIKAKLGENYQGDDDKAVAASAVDPSRWDFSDDGIIVQFQPYEVAAYAVGAATVTIPWSDLGDILVDGAQDLVLY
ncbi:MAG: DUF3298 domain-containing protein [Devosia sp.]